MLNCLTLLLPKTRLLQTMHIQVRQLVLKDLSLLKYALFATWTLHITKSRVGRTMEWSNFHHRKVDFVEFGCKRVETNDLSTIFKQMIV